LLRVEFVRLFRRHRFPVLVFAGRREVKRTFLRLAGHDPGQLAVAALHHGLERTQIKTSLDLGLVIPVTGETLLMKERNDAPHKELLGLGSFRVK
jgi:hypothetical protein